MSRLYARHRVLCQKALPEEFVQFAAPRAGATKEMERDRDAVFEMQEKVYVIDDRPPLKSVDTVQADRF
jgi:hypothetical protein